MSTSFRHRNAQMTLECYGMTSQQFSSHVVLFSAALVVLINQIHVNSLIFSSHLFYFLSLCPIEMSLLLKKIADVPKQSKFSILEHGHSVRHVLKWLL